MKDYRKKAYQRYASIQFGQFHPGSEEEFELYCRYFKKNYKRFLPRRKDAKILDIGCGMGHFLYFLQQENYSNVTGIDLSEENVNICRAKGINAAMIDVFEFMQKKNQHFDCIVMNDVIEHFKKDEILLVLSLVKGNLCEEGVFICKTNNASNPLTASRAGYIDFTHETQFTEHSLSQVLKMSGFEQVEIYPQDIYVLKNQIINLLAKTAAFVLHKIIYFLLLLHGAKGTHIFTKDIIAVARK